MKYIFRGIVILEYDPETKQVKIPNDEIKEGNFNFCIFIPEDYGLIAKFFLKAQLHAEGMDIELEDVEVA